MTCMGWSVQGLKCETTEAEADGPRDGPEAKPHQPLTIEPQPYSKDREDHTDNYQKGDRLGVNRDVEIAPHDVIDRMQAVQDGNRADQIDQRGVRSLVRQDFPHKSSSRCARPQLYL